MPVRWLAVLALVAGLGLISAAVAQDSGANTSNATVTVTGCLSNTDRVNEYQLSDQYGRIWDVHTPNSGLMTTELDHLVQVEGSVPASQVSQLLQGGYSNGSAEPVTLEMIDVRMVAENCRK